MKIINVSAAYIEIENKILIMRRSPNKSFGSLWEFPGGKIEPNETPQEAIKREMMEETNMEVIPSDIIKTTDYQAGSVVIRISFIKCELISESRIPNLLVHDSYKWVTIEEMKDIEFAPADIEFVAMIK